jgi:hypothetical protein
MKVRVYPLSELYNPNYYFEYYFEPNYGADGNLIGYTYGNDAGEGCVRDGWYGFEIFKRDINNGIIKIITDIKPKQELKKFSLV